MKYFRIRASLREAGDRFYRIVAVREDADLEELGIVLCTALGSEFEHIFMFRSGRTAFVDGSWADGPGYEEMSESHIEDLGNSFTFIYDTGEDWIFDCEVDDELFEKSGKKLAYLIDGRGQGIWEDNKDSLIRYLEGEIDPDMDHEDEEKGIFFPWNHEIERFSDFDEDFDLDLEQEDFDQFVVDQVKRYRSLRDQTVSELEDEEDDAEEDDAYEELDEKRAKEAFVDMQINNYYLIHDMLEDLRMQYPKESEEMLMERIRQELLSYADGMFDDMDDYLNGVNVSDHIH